MVIIVPVRLKQRIPLFYEKYEWLAQREKEKKEKEHPSRGQTLKNVCISLLSVPLFFYIIIFLSTASSNYGNIDQETLTVSSSSNLREMSFKNTSSALNIINSESDSIPILDDPDDGIASNGGMIRSQDEMLEGVRVLWTEPPSNDIRGILFVAHGCHHAATDWFEDCQDCVGLAEELSIVQMAVEEFKYVVVAISSVHNCWDISLDGPRVASTLQLFQQRYFEKNLPMYAFGASSGGAFVSRLGPFLEDNQYQYPNVRLQGFISQIMAAAPPSVNVPCAVYITMNRDTYTDRAAKKYVSHYSSSNPDFGDTDFKVKHIRLAPLQITEFFFHERITKLSKLQSKDMFQSLKDHEWLDSNGYLTKDPRRYDSEWSDVLRPLIPVEQDTLIADQSSMSEVLNVAYSMHELSRDGVQEALTFCTLN